MRILAGILVVLALVAVAGFWAAGRAAAPAITINTPKTSIGLQTPLDVTIEAPGGRLARVDIRLEQGGRTSALFSLDSPAEATLTQETAGRVRIARPIGKRALPALQEGTARLVVTASRSVLFGLRERQSEASIEVRVRFTPPRISIVSTHHFVNHGGAEMAIYRVTPPDVTSGVRVGDTLYPGFPASGIGVASADPGLKVAFFALLYDQDLNTPIQLYAKDDSGNEARGQFDYRVFPKPLHKSRVELADAFLNRVVPEIMSHVTELGPPPSAGENILPAFLRINRGLRQKNADEIRALAGRTAPQAVWDGPFRQLGSSKVESRFADHRTYLYKGQEVDQQVHLGYDLAVTANVPVVAGNRGKVLFADYLGIYGNAVILDHGLGVQSLYGHLASIDVKAGDSVEKGQQLGRSGMTGLAAGDHLHFAILVNGSPVSPVEWWDPHWIEDRIVRKVREAR
jgi:murein DD-endopeptidase MepM/ murein hydrolase activator NlpD